MRGLYRTRKSPMAMVFRRSVRPSQKLLLSSNDWKPTPSGRWPARLTTLD